MHQHLICETQLVVTSTFLTCRQESSSYWRMVSKCFSVSQAVVQFLNCSSSCFDCITFVYINFRGFNQIIASLTHGSIAEREEAMRKLPWTQTEKDSTVQLWTESTCLVRQTNTAHARICSLWSQVFEARAVDDQDHSCETILSYVQRAPENIQ